ncbi:MAG TPA: YkgJ family cysteine cluster protein [Methanocella sp.]|nr:YkgJ family cysteine cluster protein [Methanocella sp.]
MYHAEIEEFFRRNPGVYTEASEDDLEQLRRIHNLYPDKVRLLAEGEAVDASRFECRRCGTCCSTVRFIPVCHADAQRWVMQKRWDILERLVIDRARTPLMAIWGKGAITMARDRAAAATEGIDMAAPLRRLVTHILYVTDLVESAVYTGREDNRCVFLSGDSHTCIIHDTKPRVCEKFPFYVGKYTDPKLLEQEFCPGLKSLKELPSPD